MDRGDADARRAELLALLRIQYPDTLSDGGYQLLHPRTGEPYTDDRRHLVATCRAIANFSLGTLVDGPDWCLDAAEHGSKFLRTAHRAADRDGYHLLVDRDGNSLDETRSAYGHAFVLLAYARATAVGIDGARADLEATHELIESRFRDEAGLLRSDRSPEWTGRDDYRGQNANMHACEAYLAAYEATGRQTYLDCATRIAETITVELAAETDGLIWEHYTEDWSHDFTYNETQPRHQFRPPGYQPGHHLEWAKLLGIIDRYHDPSTHTAHAPPGGWYARATELFDAAIEHGWVDPGFVYTHDREGSPTVADQYGWAVAEGIGASATLAERATTHDDPHAAEQFRHWIDRLNSHADRYRGPAGTYYEKQRAPGTGGDLVAADPPGVEPEYHPVSAFYECWRSLGDVAFGELSRDDSTDDST